MMGLALLGSCGKSLSQQASQNVGAGAPLFFGDLVDLGHGFGADSNGVHLPGCHGNYRITTLDNVIRRDTVMNMTTTD